MLSGPGRERPAAYDAYQASRQCADTRSLCHAPSYGMHLAQNGAVLACGYTRHDPLGRYPEQTLEDIWFGPAARAMRASLRGPWFPDSCTVCRAHADEKLFERMRARDYDGLARSPLRKQAARLRGLLRSGRYAEYPASMSFELSNTCNLECVMCSGMLSSSIRRNRDHLPALVPRYGRELLPQLRPFLPHLEEALFFGGEPFLIPLYLDIWELIRELNPRCRIGITTNGTVMNDRVRRILAGLENFELVVSLDSVTRASYEAIRVNGCLEEVLANVRELQQASERIGRRLMVKPTFMRANARDFTAVYDFANREGLRFDVGVLLHPAELSLSTLPVEELAGIHDQWSSHRAAPCADAALAAENARAFRMAVDQVASWLEEQRRYHGDRRGRILAGFSPSGVMERSFAMVLDHDLRSTRDLRLPLLLAELWDRPGANAPAWCGALLAFADALAEGGDPRERARVVERLATALAQRFGEDDHALVQNLLEGALPWRALERVHAGDFDGLWQLVVEASQRPARRPAVSPDESA